MTQEPPALAVGSVNNEEPYMDSFEEHYITQSGEEIVAFGKYGYDG